MRTSSIVFNTIRVGGASLLLAAGLSLSLPARAMPITETRYVIDVEYWGTITGTFGGDDSVGDPVHRLMRIDTAFAPPVNTNLGPGFGDYFWNAPCDRGCPPRVHAPPLFVTTAGYPVRGQSDDYVEVFDATGLANRNDGIFIADSESSYRGDGTREVLSSYVQVGVSMDFLHGTGLVQEFDLHPEGSEGTGGFSTLVGNVQKGFYFVVDRIRMTPRVCKA